MRPGQSEKAAGMLATAAVGEVEDDGPQRAELRAAVASQIGATCHAVAGLGHGHRGLDAVE